MDVDVNLLGEYLLRLGFAAVIGGALGLERELGGHWAGLRTHMVVSVGSAIFMLVGLACSQGGDAGDATRVVQGIAAGIGFLGAGTILKLNDSLEIKGLTTASSIWLAAAAGTAVGIGLHLLAFAAAVVSLIVLAVLRPLERRISRLAKSRDSRDDISTEKEP